MRLFIIAAALALSVGAADATCSNPVTFLDGALAPKTASVGLDGTNCLTGFSNSGSITNPTSTLTLPATTTAYGVGSLVASSATAGSVVVPFFSIPNTAGGFYAPRLRLSTNDATVTAWGGAIMQIDLWSAAPTFTNGDRGAFFPATGTANHLGTFSCTLSPEYGDGAYTECAPVVGTTPAIRLASGTSVFWTMNVPTPTAGPTGASGVFTLTAELSN